MKALALNSSARTGGQSKTELILTPFVEGMRKAGAEVEVVNLKNKKINYCIGCYNCWTKTPGICVHKDDMTSELFPKFLESDIVVMASPLFHFQLNAQMKTFIERTLPVLQPFLVRDNDRTSHPLRHRHPKTIIISVAGFPDMSVFNPLSTWAKQVYGRHDLLLAEIYRPAAETLDNAGRLPDILEAMEQAGAEIITDGSIATSTMHRITQNITTPEMIASVSNIAWQAMIDNKLNMVEYHKSGIGMRPESVESLLAMLSFAFNPQKAKDKNGTLQFNITGEHPGACYFSIENDDVQPAIGTASKATCVIDTPFEVWADIVEGKADAAQAFMDGKYKARGDLSLLMVFGR
jgi:multimeric flavodoxin WrbA/putative sterol carrier protein